MRCNYCGRSYLDDPAVRRVVSLLGCLGCSAASFEESPRALLPMITSGSSIGLGGHLWFNQTPGTWARPGGLFVELTSS